MKSLLAKLEAATEGSLYLDGLIAYHVGLVKIWRSKHGYWNIEGPGDHHSTIEGLKDYDSETGKKNDVHAIPDYLWGNLDVPAFSSSLDASLPGENIVTVNRQFRDGRDCWQAVQAGQHVAYALTEPLARRCAALRTRGETE